MRWDDVPRVARVERASYDFPWSDGIFRDCLRVGYACRVLEQDGELIGYGVMTAAAGDAHLLNLCVHPDWRGRGLARQLLHHLLDEARSSGATRLFLEVRPSNADARRLYDATGFQLVGRRKAYYQAHEGKEDALVLARELV